MHSALSITFIVLIIASVFTSLALAKILVEILIPYFSSNDEEVIVNAPISISPSDPLSSLLYAVYDRSLYLASASWIVLVGLAIWKGSTRKLWTMRGYDYDVFKVFARMRGSEARIRILKALQMPKNRLQIAKELDMHWESIDNHINVLMRYGLVKEMISIGTAKYLTVTDRGKEILQLLERSDSGNETT
ncbi:MAG: winged helix-turn-helix domain-containing protein [Nitrososphaera sp.]|uniref:winged helix-turn-helix domain-containing protein n=1 Tax=Nitrososphaera sp. TaxID=1971748 RepID=UPI003171445F